MHFDFQSSNLEKSLKHTVFVETYSVAQNNLRTDRKTYVRDIGQESRRAIT